jgi:hypothetical protein
MGTRHTPLLERRRLIEFWRTSGLSARAFAVQRGIAPETFRRWLGEADGSASTVRRNRSAWPHCPTLDPSATLRPCRALDSWRRAPPSSSRGGALRRCCHRPAYVTAVGAAKLIAPGAAKVPTVGAAEVIGS